MRVYLGGIYIGKLRGNMEWNQAVDKTFCERGEFKRFVPCGNQTITFETRDDIRKGFAELYALVGHDAELQAQSENGEWIAAAIKVTSVHIGGFRGENIFSGELISENEYAERTGKGAKMNAKDYDLSSVKPEVVERAKRNGIVWSCLERYDPEVYALIGAVRMQQGMEQIDIGGKLSRIRQDWQPPKPVEKYVYAECKLIGNCCWGMHVPWRTGDVGCTLSAMVEIPGWGGVRDRQNFDESWETNIHKFLIEDKRKPKAVRFNRQKLIDAGVIKE